MRFTKFNVLFPFLFIAFDLLVLYFVTLLMHYLTFSEWTFHNNLIMIAWVMIVIYNKSYNIGRGVSYLITVQNALKSIFVLLALISFGNLFFNVYEFALINLLTGILIFSISVLSYRLMVHGLLDNYRKYGGKVCSFDDSTVISTNEVVLRDSNGDTIMTMVLYDGEWIRE